ncbi:hypothetical protein [Rufibacter latericius]|uniref:Type II secretion system protein GspG C-terminal domain-containing protein n=1 Tax=Rufibacter latericius TaxID=2487040 RepID=A0A3M9MD56_9BACT|nr:hypothetical protein [Rufibacter latericius]RNI23501.1 hypothetical protein EFB08_18375 [Rufibacter latericius]
MNKVVDFMALLFNIRTANNTEGYQRGRFGWMKTLLMPFRWAVLLLVAGTVLLLLISLLTDSYFKEKNTRKKLSQLAAVIVKHEQRQRQLPSSLPEAVANSPLHRDLTLDSWGQPILYKHNPGKKTFLLLSGGKDRQLHTKDDLAQMVQIESSGE